MIDEKAQLKLIITHMGNCDLLFHRLGKNCAKCLFNERCLRADNIYQLAIETFKANYSEKELFDILL